MIEDQKKKASWIQLNYHDDDVIGVTVSPANGDLFALTKELAIRGCSIGSRLHELEAQLAKVRDQLKQWASDHSEHIQKAYLALKGTGFLFLIIQKSMTYDRILEDALTELDLNIAQNSEFSLIDLSVLAIADSSEATIRTFFPVDTTMASVDGQ